MPYMARQPHKISHVYYVSLGMSSNIGKISRATYHEMICSLTTACRKDLIYEKLAIVVAAIDQALLNDFGRVLLVAHL